MTFAEFKKLVLQHIDQYSVSGTSIPATYNNQADYVQRICGLGNIALRTIATQTEKLLTVFDPNAEDFTGRQELSNGWTKITMPADFWMMSGNGMPTIRPDGSYSRAMDYSQVSSNEILMRTKSLSGAMIAYFRYPRKLGGADTEVLDCSEMAADCASFYVAAELVRQDSPYLYQTLYNEYETMLARLRKPTITEYAPTEDVYAFY